MAQILYMLLENSNGQFRYVMYAVVVVLLLKKTVCCTYIMSERLRIHHIRVHARVM